MLSKLNFSSVSRGNESKSDRSISRHGVTLICNHIITFIDYFFIAHTQIHTHTHQTGREICCQVHQVYLIHVTFSRYLYLILSLYATVCAMLDYSPNIQKFQEFKSLAYCIWKS